MGVQTGLYIQLAEEGGKWRALLLLHILHHRLDTSSDAAEGENGVEPDRKKQRSASTTPINAVGRARAPFELDQLMGIGSARSPSREETDSERESSDEEATDDKSLIDSTPSIRVHMFRVHSPKAPK